METQYEKREKGDKPVVAICKEARRLTTTG